MDKVKLLELKVSRLERQVESLYGMLQATVDLLSADQRVNATLAEIPEDLKANAAARTALVGSAALARATAQVPLIIAHRRQAISRSPYAKGRKQLIAAVKAASYPMEWEPAADPEDGSKT